MTLNKDALEFLEHRSLQAHDVGGTSTPVRLLPKDVAVKSLEPFMAQRSRYRGSFATHHITDCALYAAKFPGGHCFVDQEAMAAAIFFNLGTTEVPGHGDHSANIKLDKTAPFIALRSMVSKHLSQKDLAEWLEDWAPYLVAFNGAGEAVTIGAAVAAVRRITIAAKSESTSTVQDFGAERSGFEAIEARSEENLPAGFRFTCAPYHGLDQRSFELRMSVITGEPPKLVLRDVRFEEVEEAMAQEFAEKLETALKSAGADADVYLGTFTVGN